MKARFFSALMACIVLSVSAIAAEHVDLRFNGKVFNSKDGFSSHAARLGLGADENLQLIKQYRDSIGQTHYRYRQTYRGVPVWGEHVVITETARGQMARMHGQLVRGIAADMRSTLADFDAKTAVTIAKGAHADSFSEKLIYENEKSELVIYMDKNNQARLTYAVTYFSDSLEGGTPSRPTSIIDARSGEILFSFDGLTTAEGVGPGGNAKTGAYYYGTDYPAFTVTTSGSTCIMNNANVRAVDLKNRRSNSSNTAFQYACFENTYKAINGAYSPINDALYFGGVVFDMYSAWVGAAPLTFQLSMKVHYSRKYENAFWNGQAMTFGDGASTFYPLVSLDVSAHEVSHGFTEQNSGLNYSAQSGGINEAYSDIAGEAAENYMRGSNDFLVGAEIFKSNGALRYMANPPQDGRSIGCASDYTSGMDVHYSSGVFNKAFYLLATTAGWSTETAFRCFAKANQNYWTPSTNYVQGAQAVVDAAGDLGYDTTDVIAAFAGVCINL